MLNVRCHIQFQDSTTVTQAGTILKSSFKLNNIHSKIHCGEAEMTHLEMECVNAKKYSFSLKKKTLNTEIASENCFNKFMKCMIIRYL